MNAIDNSFSINFAIRESEMHMEFEKDIIDEKKFNEIYELYYNRIVYYANSYLQDGDESKNIAHDVFMQLWKNRRKINRKNNQILYWLISVTRNSCINILKKRMYSEKYRNSGKQRKSDMINCMLLQSDVSSRIFENEIDSLLCASMNSMNEKVRSTFILSRIKGLKNQEVAQMQHLSIRAVEARIRTAMMILRKFFKDYINDEHITYHE